MDAGASAIGEHGANLSQSLKRLSTGIKIEGAGDPGRLSVSGKLDSAIGRSLALGANVQNALSFLEAQDAAQNRLGEIITRMAELRQRFDDTIRNSQDGTVYNREFKELKEEVKSIANKKFNGISLFSNENDDKSQLVVNTSEDGKNSSAQSPKPILQVDSGNQVQRRAHRCNQSHARGIRFVQQYDNPNGRHHPGPNRKRRRRQHLGAAVEGTSRHHDCPNGKRRRGGNHARPNRKRLARSNSVKNDLKATQGTVSASHFGEAKNLRPLDLERDDRQCSTSIVARSFIT